MTVKQFFAGTVSTLVFPGIFALLEVGILSTWIN